MQINTDFFKRFGKSSIELQNVQVCDATKDDSSNAADYIIIAIILYKVQINKFTSNLCSPFRGTGGFTSSPHTPSAAACSAFLLPPHHS